MPVVWLPHFPRSAWCLQLHGRWHPHEGSLPRRRSLTLLHTLVRILQWLWKSKHREPNSCPNIISTKIVLSCMTPSSKFSRCNCTFVSNFAFAFFDFQICDVRFIGIIVQFFKF